jgi:broad specificity phosphatase PhoE
VALYLLRHGQTHFDLEQRIEGSGDSPLTSLGRDQARAMGGKLRGMLETAEGGDADYEIICSPQPRAYDSALLVREAWGIDRPVITDARLVELGCGSWEKHHFASIQGRDPLVEDEPTFLAAWAHHCVDGEGLDEAVERLWGWLRWAGNRKLVVVGHGLAGSMLRALYVGEGRDDMLKYEAIMPGQFHRLENGWAEEIAVV